MFPEVRQETCGFYFYTSSVTGVSQVLLLLLLMLEVNKIIWIEQDHQILAGQTTTSPDSINKCGDFKSC